MEWGDTKDADQVGDYRTGPGRGTRAGAEGVDWELIDETGLDKNKFITLGERGRERHQRYPYGFGPAWGHKQKQGQQSRRGLGGECTSVILNTLSEGADGASWRGRLGFRRPKTAVQPEGQA